MYSEKMIHSKYGDHFWKVTYFSFLFFVIYTPNNAVLNLIGSVQEENGLGKLGFFLIGILYLV